MKRLNPFETVHRLDNDEAVAAHLSQLLAAGNPRELLRSLSLIVQMRGLPQVAQAAGLDQDSLFQVFAPGAQPGFQTVQRVLQALGVRITAQAMRRD